MVTEVNTSEYFFHSGTVAVPEVVDHKVLCIHYLYYEIIRQRDVKAAFAEPLLDKAHIIDILTRHIRSLRSTSYARG